MKQSIEEENRILSLLQSDPEAGLSEAMNAYGSTVKWIAGCVLGAGQREDVEECVAETFVRLWQSSGSRFRPHASLAQEAGTPVRTSEQPSLFSYVCGIARHVAIDMRRKRKAMVLSLEARRNNADSGVQDSSGDAWEAAEREDLSAEEAARIGGDFAGLLVRAENHKMLQEAVEGLPSPDREIFLLRYWLDLRVAQVAERLQLTEKQVENRLYRGKAALRKRLTERGMER